MSYLLLSCSKRKKITNEPIPAIELYKGSLFLGGKIYAERNNLKIYILSAKYGFIGCNELILPYDNKLEKPYNGIWPPDKGFYLGSELYFGNAPEYIKPLIPKGLKPGDSVNAVYCLLAGVDVNNPDTRITVIGTIYKTLCHERLTKLELYERLAALFGPLLGMKQTINCQLLQSRMGKEKHCIIHKENDKYWIEPLLVL